MRKERERAATIALGREYWKIQQSKRVKRSVSSLKRMAYRARERLFDVFLFESLAYKNLHSPMPYTKHRIQNYIFLLCHSFSVAKQSASNLHTQGNWEDSVGKPESGGNERRRISFRTLRIAGKALLNSFCGIRVSYLYTNKKIYTYFLFLPEHTHTICSC